MGASDIIIMKLLFLCLVALVAVVYSAPEPSNMVSLSGGLQYSVTKTSACSAGAKAGDKLSMHSTGTIDPNSATGVKGQKFDSSLDRGTPFSFTLGVGQVIQGGGKGLVGICPGEKRNLVIPPEMGYGSSGAGNAIPGGATLDFSVECLSIN